MRQMRKRRRVLAWPRDRLAGAGLKPPEAAWIKSPGSERSGKRPCLTGSGVISGDERK